MYLNVMRRKGDAVRYNLYTYTCKGDKMPGKVALSYIDKPFQFELSKMLVRNT